MHFQISLSLWELQVTKDFLCVKDIAGIFSNRLLLLLILKINQISLETNCVGVSFFNKIVCLRAWNIFCQQLTALDLVLNTSLSHKLNSTYHYSRDVCKDPNDYRISRPEVFCKKSVLRNFAKFTGKHLYQSLFLPATLFKTMTLVQVISCEFCEIF